MGNRGPELAAVLILFLIITWLIVALRCHVRVRMLKSFGLDDWFMVASLVRINPFYPASRQVSDMEHSSLLRQAVFTLYCAFALGGVEYGTGRHLKDLNPHSIQKALRVRPVSSCSSRLPSD